MPYPCVVFIHLTNLVMIREISLVLSLKLEGRRSHETGEIPSSQMCSYNLLTFRNVLSALSNVQIYDTKPALLSCLGSAAASNTPSGNTLTPWTALECSPTQSTLCCLRLILSTVLLSNVVSKVVKSGSN